MPMHRFLQLLIKTLGQRAARFSPDTHTRPPEEGGGGWGLYGKHPLVIEVEILVSTVSKKLTLVWPRIIRSLVDFFFLNGWYTPVIVDGSVCVCVRVRVRE